MRFVISTLLHSFLILLLTAVSARSQDKAASQADPLVRVRFRMADIWGARAERGEDVIEAEIYAHWLEPV